MSTCPHCGGLIGRDCFNVEECGDITRQMVDAGTGEIQNALIEAQKQLGSAFGRVDVLRAEVARLVDELDCRVGDLVMLRKAIEAGDPRGQFFVRIDDMLRDTRDAIAKASQP